MTRYDSAFSNALQTLQETQTNPLLVNFKFFMEDIFTDDLDLFIREYDIFIRTKQSDFFFKANLANIAILLVNYHQRAFDTYFQQHDQSRTLDLDHVWRTFDQFKPALIAVLKKAYRTCHYTDVLQVYRLYLTFYQIALGEALTDLPLDFYKADANMVSIITQNSNNEYYIYLSCNHSAEFRQARFYMTRIIESHIGLKGLHGDAIVSTLGCLYHDFYFHGNLERVKNIDEELIWCNRRFILALYKETAKTIYQYGLYTLHIIQNEWFHGKIVKFDRQDFFPFFCYVKNNHLIMKRENDNYETVAGYLRWLTDKSFVLNDWDEEGRGYTIKV